ncbi:hypothetical protein BVRB_8g184990 [Beta vulgaris subsp. vulgaris]|uniref:Uncharacterized protein n=1 Tax=Beta vulgaris subsp. vulgaris TaxID=3555 RepID=A0A0J8BW23_BETVV|nr:hypothetical protein BVRB_8g184990 [Beta vulgaris subsp. vulgaris]
MALYLELHSIFVQPMDQFAIQGPNLDSRRTEETQLEG